MNYLYHTKSLIFKFRNTANGWLNLIQEHSKYHLHYYMAVFHWFAFHDLIFQIINIGMIWCIAFHCLYKQMQMQMKNQTTLINRLVERSRRRKKWKWKMLKMFLRLEMLCFVFVMTFIMLHSCLLRSCLHVNSFYRTALEDYLNNLYYESHINDASKFLTVFSLFFSFYDSIVNIWMAFMSLRKIVHLKRINMQF